MKNFTANQKRHLMYSSMKLYIVLFFSLLSVMSYADTIHTLPFKVASTPDISTKKRTSSFRISASQVYAIVVYSMLKLPNTPLNSTITKFSVSSIALARLENDNYTDESAYRGSHDWGIQTIDSSVNLRMLLSTTLLESKII